jgi:hypothetical protein
MTTTLEQQQGDGIAYGLLRNALQARAIVRRAENQVAQMIGRPVEDARALLDQIEATPAVAEGETR